MSSKHTSKEISKVIELVAKESKKFILPSVTQVSVNENDPYKVLISCILSLRTRDETTLRVSNELFSLASNPKEMISLPIEKLESAIRSVNYYKTKAKNIKAISQSLIDQYDSKVPNRLDDLLKLKGVGRKTANIVLVYAYNKDAIPVDTHVHRIPNRLGWISTKHPEQTEQELLKIIPKKYWQTFNDVFVAFGQNICKPISPKCNICPVNTFCDYYKKDDAQTTHIRRANDAHPFDVQY